MTPAFWPLLGVRTVRRAAIAIGHVGLWACAFVLAVALRFEGHVPEEAVSPCLLTLLLLAAARFLVFARMRLFDGLFRYTGLSELRRLVGATTGPTVLLLALGPSLVKSAPRAVLIAEWFASILAVGGMRMLVRAAHERSPPDKAATSTLVVGVNDTGEGLVREILRTHGTARFRVVGFLDDGADALGTNVHGVPVLGPASEEAVRAAVASHRVEQVVFALSEMATEATRQLVGSCRRLGLRTLVVPSLAERMSPSGGLPAREVALEDLLGREPVRLDHASLEALIRGRVVLVTGAGGSIGSELARQVLPFSPRILILFDHDENALFYLERELRARCGEAELETLAGDITDFDRVAFVFGERLPHLVLHAAAHKHVAMMESNACEAARNNVFGTRVVAEAAHDAGTSTFVLISTDKAVNPSSVMGATKRVCEMVIQHIARHSETRFAAVRFGNVLGSRGSVVPLFREQIARSGPVTVTHPEVTRYFMTIPEAAGLVLQASALGGTGKVFLLDMGKPVKIVDLARALIELSGLRPGIDIQIAFTGLKPGEKLTEELLLGSEALEERPHPKIMVGNVCPPQPQEFERGMRALGAAIHDGDDAALRRALALLVPEATLAPPARINLPQAGLARGAAAGGSRRG
jgi:FlaA1/EpsC-like NDP-sugar epimerase